MKRTKIIYWVVTGIFALSMISTAIPNVMNDADSIKLISTQLGFPQYFVPFIGVAKILGAIAILIPGFPRIKEWAYAGLFFDLAGATFGSFAVFGYTPGSGQEFMFVFIGFHLLSYYMYHKKLREEKAAGATA